MSIALTYETFGSPCINVDCCCEIVKNVAMLRVTRAGAIWSFTQKESQLKKGVKTRWKPQGFTIRQVLIQQ